MKRSWSTILPVVGLVGLLPLLGGLQYRWLKQINESDGEKARQRLQEQTDHFAADFNREIQNAYFNFQTDSETWKEKNWNAFNERYDFWRQKTAYPGLIADIYFFEAKPEALPLRYDVSARSFVHADAPAILTALRAQFSDEKSFRPVYAEAFTLVLPIQDPLPEIKRSTIRLRSPMNPALRERYGYLAIRLDSATIKEKILPDLTAKYFGDGEFRPAIVDTAGHPVYQFLAGDKDDAAAGLFDLSPDNYVFFANKEMMSTLGTERKQGPGGGVSSGPIERREGIVLNSHVESHTFNRVQTDNENNGSVKIEVKRDSSPRTAVFTTSVTNGSHDKPWTLQVQHSSGSLDIYMANTLRRNLAAGFGILLLLAAAIGAIIFSTQRVKRLAQRQIDFVSSVSHEFRTPLAVIYSAGENLADGVTKETKQISRYGQLIKGEGRKLSSMVEQILEFAGANSGRQKYNFAELEPREVLDDALADCRPLIEEKNVRVESSISGALPTIVGDRRALSQAVQNLVANAVKYSNGQPWVRVAAENGGDSVKISVEDHGIGISRGDLRQIFEPFYRSKEVVDAQIHGNGLGLSLVKQIAEAHGGKVTARSEPGKGSKFTIEIPQA